jgi:hypothetical protein
MIDTVSLTTGARGRRPVHLSDDDRTSDGVALCPDALRDLLNDIDGPDEEPYPGYHAGPYDVVAEAFTFDGDLPF